MQFNDAELAFAAWQADEERARQRTVVQARRYYNGEQDTFLTTRMKQFLNAKDDNEFNLNVCRTVVGAVEERLAFNGITTNEQGDMQPVVAWADELYEAAGLGVLTSDVHDGALRDGEFFLVVDWDEAKQRPRMIPHPRYTDPEVGGDGFGCKAHYPDDDTSQPMLYASKRWTEKLPDGKARQRMTLYYADRVEKYELVSQAPKPIQDEGDAGWPIPWVGRIPVIHFRNTNDLRPEHWDAIPVQKGINKTLVDLLASADLTAFQIYVALGWIPTTDGKAPAENGSNWLALEPGQIIGTPKSRQDVDFKAIPGDDLRPLLDLLMTLISGLAVVSSTPESRVSFTRQIAAEGTLKEQNEGLFAKVRRRQAMFDQAWVEAFTVARLLANMFGEAGLDEAVELIGSWDPIQARDTQDERDEWRVKKELGVPVEQIWAEMGYSADQIEMMKGMDEYRARMAMMDLGLNAGEG